MESELSILIVEDDDAARLSLCNMIALEFPSLVIRSADNGQSGLQSYARHPADMVLTDIRMPGMDGVSMAAELKYLNPEVPIIALTSYSDTKYLLQAIEVGIDSYLLKPLDFQKLYIVLHRKIASMRGNSQRKKMAADLLTYQEELEAANELLEQRVSERTADLEASIKDQEAFSYSVSHDLRAPLRHINSFSSILVEEYERHLPDDARRYLDRIIDASNRMGAFIDHLLESSRLGRTQITPEPVNLSALAHAIFRMLQDVEPHQAVEHLIEENMVAMGDLPLLRQLMQNLLGNAWKYSALKPLSRIEFGFSPEHSAFFVKDNGAGFDMAYKDDLFKAFQRLHGAEFEGDGVGLSTVQRIVSRHGGRIWAEGRVGEGATFFFTLPLYKKDEAACHSEGLDT